MRVTPLSVLPHAAALPCELAGASHEHCLLLRQHLENVHQIAVPGHGNINGVFEAFVDTQVGRAASDEPAHYPMFILDQAGRPSVQSIPLSQVGHCIPTTTAHDSMLPQRMVTSKAAASFCEEHAMPDHNCKMLLDKLDGIKSQIVDVAGRQAATHCTGAKRVCAQCQPCSIERATAADRCYSELLLGYLHLRCAVHIAVNPVLLTPIVCLSDLETRNASSSRAKAVNAGITSRRWTLIR